MSYWNIKKKNKEGGFEELSSDDLNNGETLWNGQELSSEEKKENKEKK